MTAETASRKPLLTMTNCVVTQREGETWLSDLWKGEPATLVGYRILPLEDWQVMQDELAEFKAKDAPDPDEVAVDALLSCYFLNTEQAETDYPPLRNETLTAYRKHADEKVRPWRELVERALNCFDNKWLDDAQAIIAKGGA